MGIRILDGRMFTDADSANAPPVVVVSHAWAVKYSRRESAVGKRLYGGGCTSYPPRVRVALGAPPGSLVRLIVGRGMRYALVGTGIGLVATAFESHWLGSLLFSVGATDPATLSIAVVTLLAIAALAC